MSETRYFEEYRAKVLETLGVEDVDIEDLRDFVRWRTKVLEGLGEDPMTESDVRNFEKWRYKVLEALGVTGITTDDTRNFANWRRKVLEGLDVDGFTEEDVRNYEKWRLKVIEVLENMSPSGTVTGDIVTFIAWNNTVIKSLVVNLEPIQEGSGDPSPDNVRPISGHTECVTEVCGSNIFGGEAFADGIKTAIPQAVLDTDAKTISYASGYVTEGSNFTSGLPFKSNTQYTIILKFSNTKARTNMRVVYTDGTNKFIPTSVTGLQTVVFTTATNKTIDYIGGLNSDGASVFYYDECGVFEGNLTADDFEPYQGNTYTTTLGRTVYGGTLDVVSGELVVDRAMVDLGTLTWNVYNGKFTSVLNPEPLRKTDGNINMLCPKYVTGTFGSSASQGDKKMWLSASTSSNTLWVEDSAYSDAAAFKTAMNGVQLCYELATPQTYQLTPTEIKTLKGNNTLWSDGEVTVVYGKGAKEGGD